MNSEHEPPCLGDLVDSDRGITYGVVQPGQHQPGGVPIVRVKDIRGGLINDTDPLRIAPETAAKHSRTSLQGGELLLTLVGTVGETAIVPTTLAGWNTARAVAVIPVRDDPGAKWVQYSLQTGAARQYIHTRLNTTVQATLNLRDVSALPVPLLGPADRDRVLAVLGALDDKIELNRKMNQTLEAMAQALFKSWFVNFDPVIDNALRAGNPIPDDLADKAERRKAVMAREGYSVPEYAGLFPDEFVESELGSIPAGWRASTLGHETERCGGLIQTGPFGSQLHASDYVDVGIPVMMPKNIKNRRVLTEGIARITDEDADRLARHRVQEGDLVYSRRGDVEKHALIGPREIGWLCGTGCLLVRLGSGWPSPLYTSLSLNQPDIRAWISQHAIGATMPNLNTGILSAVPLLAPPDALIETFAELTRPMNKLSVSNDAENESLSAIRDTLLPKLISGEVRVPEIDGLIDEATA